MRMFTAVMGFVASRQVFAALAVAQSVLLLIAVVLLLAHGIRDLAIVGVGLAVFSAALARARYRTDAVIVRGPTIMFPPR